MSTVEHPAAIAETGNGQPVIAANVRADGARLTIAQIQGNIVGFNKPFQAFLFLQFAKRTPDDWRTWLKEVAEKVTSVETVLAYRKEFRDFKDAAKRDHPEWDATQVREAFLQKRRAAGEKDLWLNLAFTHAGLAKLETIPLTGFPPEFVAGMAERAGILGDEGDGSPDQWRVPEQGQELHALMILASDDATELGKAVTDHRAVLKAKGIKVIRTQKGQAIGGDLGREYFGFRDGVSQPAFRDLDVNPPGSTHQGQDRIWPGEFILGYRREPNPGARLLRAAAVGENDWAMNGSYLVFRRLKQDVPAFEASVRQAANDLGLGEERLKAKLIGRYPSGAPLAAFAPPAPDADPGAPGSQWLDDKRINSFGYAKDEAGERVPRGAHIRRLNPRDQDFPGRSVARTRRILRRGLPFEDEEEGTVEQGLLFICYQSSIANQFEFLQRSWANDAYFPPPYKGDTDKFQPGRDPLVGRGPEERQFHIPGANGGYATLKRWVTMTGGGYFFSPSLSALGDLVTGDRLLHPPLADEAAAAKEAKDAKIWGRGDCRLQITVAFKDLDPKLYYPWRIWLQGTSVWESQPNDYLAPDKEGFATGTMTVRLLRILEALEPDLTAGEIVRVLRRVEDGETPGEVLGAYGIWQVELITAENASGDAIVAIRQADANQAVAIPPKPGVWAAEPVGKLFSIDMGLWPA